MGQQKVYDSYDWEKYQELKRVKEHDGQLVARLWRLY